MTTALDLETYLIEPGRQAPPPIVMSLARGSDTSLAAGGEITSTVRALLEAREPLVNHNIAFDFAVIGAAEPALLEPIFQAYDDDRVFDTAVRQKLLDNAHGVLASFYRRGGKPIKIGYSLANLVDRIFRVQLDKDTWRLRYAELAEVPLAEWPEGARRYVIDDAVWALKVFDAQEEERFDKGHDLLADQHRQVRHDFWLRLMSTWGLVTDEAAVRAFVDGKRAEREALAQRLLAVGLVARNRDGTWKREQKYASAKIISAYRNTQRECPRTEPSDRHPEGQPMLDEASCVASGDEDLIAYAEFSSLTKVISTDGPLLESGTRAPIHAHFNSLLETGRTSSSPNIQNLPRPTFDENKKLIPGVRECFVPRPGYVFASADFSKLELHTWAQILFWRFGESKLGDALNAGRDPHTEMAARILGITYEECAARVDAGDPIAKNARDCAKPANFGFPGGLGSKRFVAYALGSYKVVITEAASAKLKDTWFKQWDPDPQRYFAWMSQEDATNQRIRHPRSHRYRGRATYTARCNGYFQGLGADAAKAAGWDLARACYVDRNSVLYGSRPVNFVHDEYIVEVPEAIGHECAHELARIMQDAARPWTENVPVQVGAPVLMRRWSKAAKPIWKDGRLVPWG